MAHIKSFGDLDGEDSDSEHDDVNDYYAGGKASGQLIRGAPDKDKEDGDKVKSLFEKARKAGASDGRASDLEGPSGAFRGPGRTLASGEPAANAQDAPSKHVICFYRNGIFTVDNGPGRNVNDAANFKFIDSISRGECPEELEAAHPGMTVDVNLLRKDEDYVEPEKPKYSAFQGTGRTLAGAASSNASASTSSAVAAAASAAGEWQGVNEALPTTSLQLRMADGSRMVARFNHSHKVSDIRRFIRASRPDSQLIQDEDRTLEEAGLLNAVIIQKI